MTEHGARSTEHGGPGRMPAWWTLLSAVLATAGILGLASAAAFWLHAEDESRSRSGVVFLLMVVAWGAFSAGRLHAQRGRARP